MSAPEWLRDLRGWPAYVLLLHTPLWRAPLWATGWLWACAGDWIYRDERRALPL